MTRTEFFDKGTIARAEEDTDGDGRVDRWETYRDGRVASVALDTAGHGRPDRRMIYGADGAVERVEVDPEGRGVFAAAPEPPAGRKP